MDRWMDGRTDRWMDGRTDRWMDGWIGGLIDGKVDGWMDGWMDGWAERRTGAAALACLGLSGGAISHTYAAAAFEGHAAVMLESP